MHDVVINKRLNPEILEDFRKIVGGQYLFLDEESMEIYSRDQTEKLQFFPDVILKPRSAKEISEIFKICNENSIPSKSLSTGIFVIFIGNFPSFSL